MNFLGNMKSPWNMRSSIVFFMDFLHTNPDFYGMLMGFHGNSGEILLRFEVIFFFGLLTHLAIVETRNPGWPTSRS